MKAKEKCETKVKVKVKMKTKRSLTGRKGEDTVRRHEMHGFHACAEGIRNSQTQHLLLRRRQNTQKFSSKRERTCFCGRRTL